MTSPYNENFVTLLKRLIPDSDRSWDKAGRIWTFSERYFQPVRELCESIWPGSVSVVTKTQAAKAQSGPTRTITSIDEVILKFFKLCPQDAMLKAYRATALSLHPDRGGDMEKMSVFNSLWSRLEKEFYGKLSS